MIRKVYIRYLIDAVLDYGPLYLFKYFKRYIGTYGSYKLNRSLSGPIQGTLCLTYNCNLRCEMCDLPQRHLEFKNKGLKPHSLDEWYEIIDDFYRIGCSAIAISGGEPLLHKDIIKIVKRIKKRKMVCQITSNGWFITEDMANQLINAGLDTISISIDGDEDKLHDKIRGVKGSFSKALEAINTLDRVRKKRLSKLKISISTVFGKSNYQNIENSIDILKKSGADRIGFIPVHYIAPNVEAKNLSHQELEQMNEVINNLILRSKRDPFIETSDRYFSLFKDFFMGKPLPMNCLAGFTTILVDCYGEVFPCFSFYEMKKSWGNIKETGGLKAFWYSHLIKDQRSSIRSCRDCYWNCQVETNLLYKLK